MVWTMIETPLGPTVLTHLTDLLVVDDDDLVSEVHFVFDEGRLALLVRLRFWLAEGRTETGGGTTCATQGYGPLCSGSPGRRSSVSSSTRTGRAGRARAP